MSLEDHLFALVFMKTLVIKGRENTNDSNGSDTLLHDVVCSVPDLIEIKWCDFPPINFESAMEIVVWPFNDIPEAIGIVGKWWVLFESAQWSRRASSSIHSSYMGHRVGCKPLYQDSPHYFPQPR